MTQEATAQLLTQENSRDFTSVMEVDVTQNRNRVSTGDGLLTTYIKECCC